MGIKRIRLLSSSSSSFLSLSSSPLLISIGGVGSLVGSFPFLFAVGLFAVGLFAVGLGVAFFLRVVRIGITFYLIFYLAFFEGLAMAGSGLAAGYLAFLKGLAIALETFTSYKVQFFLQGRIEAHCRVVDRFLLGIT